MDELLPAGTGLPAAQLGADSGEGLQYSLEPTWAWAPWLTLLLVIAAVALVLVLYLRERGRAGLPVRLALAAIRLLLIGLVLLMLFGWTLHRDRMDLPDMVLLIDESESMQFEDRLEDAKLQGALARRVRAAGLKGATRLNLAKALLMEHDGRLLRWLSRKYNLKIYRIGPSARPETGGVKRWSETVRQLEAHQPTSRLGKCLRQVLQLQRGRPTAAVILLTDGITTEGKSIGEVAQYARRKAIPLYPVGLGSDRPPRDVRLTDLLVDDVVFVNDLVSFDVRLTSVGYEGKTIRLRLRRQNDGRVLAEQPVRLGRDGQTVSARLSHRPPQVGDFQYVVDFRPLPGELVAENNRASKLVSVRDEKIRVLLVQAYPSFEFRYLSALLGRQLVGRHREASKAIELTTVLQEADEGFAEADESVRRVFPVRRDELFEYDAIIFGDVNPAGLGRLEMNHLAEFVKNRGGGIVFISGPRYTPLEYRDTPLADLMPIDVQTAAVPSPGTPLRQKFSVQLTRLGLASPQMMLGDSPEENQRIWRSLDGLYWLLEAPDVKPAARILAEHPTRTGTDGRNLPVICMQFVGAGKVIFHATDETYRWRYRVGDKYFARYWIQTLRYLSRAKLLGKSHAVQLTSDFDQYRRGDPIHLRARFFQERLAPPQDDGVTLVVEREQGKRRYVKLHRRSSSRGVFEGTITNLPEGQYRAWLATPALKDKPPSLRLSVAAPPGEQARLEMDSADLKLAARISKGRFYTMANADRLAAELPRGRQVRIASLPPVPLWGMWFVAMGFGLLFLLLIVSEWLLRKSVGML